MELGVFLDKNLNATDPPALSLHPPSRASGYVARSQSGKRVWHASQNTPVAVVILFALKPQLRRGEVHHSQRQDPFLKHPSSQQKRPSLEKHVIWLSGLESEMATTELCAGWGTAIQPRPFNSPLWHFPLLPDHLIMRSEGRKISVVSASGGLLRILSSQVWIDVAATYCQPRITIRRTYALLRAPSRHRRPGGYIQNRSRRAGYGNARLGV